jgi:hypothetical protein
VTTEARKNLLQQFLSGLGFAARRAAAIAAALAEGSWVSGRV